MAQLSRSSAQSIASADEDPVWLQQLTPLWFAERSGAVFPEKTAVVYGERRYSYREFAGRVNRLASALRAAGLRKGDRVAVLCPNIPPMLEAHFGVPLAGGILVTINVRLSTGDISYILEHSGAKFLFVDTELGHLIDPSRQRALEQIVSIVDTVPTRTIPGPTYEEFLALGRPDRLDWLLESENDTISINYTSGTTGRPKGVMYTHRGAYLKSLGLGLHLRLSADSVYLWTLPMFHCNGWGFPWGVTAVAGTHLCVRRIDPGLIWHLIARENVSHFCAAPTVLVALVNHLASRQVELKRKLTVATGGAPPSPTIIHQMATLGATVVHIYGLTETYAPYTICEEQPGYAALPPEEQARFKARQGVPLIVSDVVRVVDESLDDVPSDGQTLGEVVMRGNNVTKGYFAQPEATAEAFRGGWFHSGDLAVMHPDGYVELRDRKKDIIISGGENISTIEIEQVIDRHPAVLEVAVIAIPDPRWGEVPKAFVTAKSDQSVTAEAIIAFCRERLAHFKCPRAVEFGDLPKTSTGKIQKFVLREREWTGMAKRIN
ncbi:MAG TPA: acyl--CoA ligase family protein [Chloroflexota bacterium]|nr:acyl--CoA ligase family protein [Chloroflexota bacterium]